MSDNDKTEPELVTEAREQLKDLDVEGGFTREGAYILERVQQLELRCQRLVLNWQTLGDTLSFNVQELSDHGTRLESKILANGQYTNDALNTLEGMIRTNSRACSTGLGEAMARRRDIIRDLKTVDSKLEIALRSLDEVFKDGDFASWHTLQHAVNAAAPGQVAFVPGLGTVHECMGCGCLVAGGATRCKRCARELSAAEKAEHEDTGPYNDCNCEHCATDRGFGERPVPRWADPGMNLSVCSVCGTGIAQGVGIGVSASEEEWLDKSQPRTVKLIPMCHSCQGKRMVTMHFDARTGALSHPTACIDKDPEPPWPSPPPPPLPPFPASAPGKIEQAMAEALTVDLDAENGRLSAELTRTAEKLEAARQTNSKLNRRAQAAESKAVRAHRANLELIAERRGLQEDVNQLRKERDEAVRRLLERVG